MIEIIPAIDIIDGKCVRLSKGDYDSKKIYNENPVEVAKEFEAYGIRRLHVVDLDGAKSNHIVNYRILEQLAGRTSLIIDFGGGIKSDEDLIIAFDNGAQMVTVGSIAVKKPELFEKWLNKYGHEQIARGGSLMLYDAESSDKWELTLDKFLRGLALAIESGASVTIDVESGYIDTSDVDAECADLIIQFALFGDLVFG